MAKDRLFTAAVCHAAATCFAAGDTLKGVASALDTYDMKVRRALERGRKPGAPNYLAAMAQAYDDYEASGSARKRPSREFSKRRRDAETRKERERDARKLARHRRTLARAAGLPVEVDDAEAE